MQRINLYLPEFRASDKPLSFKQLILASVGFLLLFIAYGWWESTQTQVFREQLLRETQMLEPLKVQQKELQKMVANRPQESRLDGEIAQLELEVKNKTLALNTLRSSDVSASDGFSVLLKDLAKNNNKRLWFTSIELKQDVLKLQGQTLDPKNISDWISKLKNHSSLARNFSAVTINENQNNKRVYDFELTDGVLVQTAFSKQEASSNDE